MKYIVRCGKDVVVHESKSKVYRVGDVLLEIPESDKVMWKVVSPGVTDYFLEKFWSVVEEEFFDFQADNGIDYGDIPFDLDFKMHLAVEAMTLAMAQAKAWQLANLTEVK